MNPLLRRLRHDLFATPADGLITVALLAVIGAGASSSCLAAAGWGAAAAAWCSAAGS